jgi:hypothetical protein
MAVNFAAMINPKDYYAILELEPSASMDEIKKAYRRLALQLHPDKNAGDPYAALQFSEVKEAYEVLTNPSKKAYYLQQRWYHLSTGKRKFQQTVNPVNILQQLLELDKYVATLDTHRMDRQGLYDHLTEILSEEAIEKMNAFNEIQVNTAIVRSALNSSTPLPLDLFLGLSQRLEKINAGPGSIEWIRQVVKYRQQNHLWEKYRVWIVILVVLVLSLFIYYVSK